MVKTIFHWIPAISYKRVQELQSALVLKRIEGSLPFNVVLGVEHPPTFTVGRRIKYFNDEERLAKIADFQYTKRGGQITFHGPGQLVLYPILNIKELNIGARCYVHKLEEVVINSLEYFQIHGKRTENTGIWIDDKKIAALGIQIQRYVTSHGIALNCNTDLKWFENIVPCGLEGLGVTSISQELNKDVNIKKAIPIVLDAFESNFNCRFEENQEFTKLIDSLIK